MKTKAAKQPKKSKRALKLKDIKPKPKTNPKGGERKYVYTVTFGGG